MTRIEQIVTAAFNWEPLPNRYQVHQAVEGRFAIFDPIEGETDRDRTIREAARHLAMRIDRDASEDAIRCAAVQLARLVCPTPEPAFNYEAQPASPSFGAQVALGAAVGLAVAAAARSNIGKTIVHQAVRSAVHGGFRELFR